MDIGRIVVEDALLAKPSGNPVCRPFPPPLSTRINIYPKGDLYIITQRAGRSQKESLGYQVYRLLLSLLAYPLIILFTPKG